MSTLRELQAKLCEALQRPTTLADDPAMVALAKSVARGNDRMSPVAQVDVYREQFFLRHVDALWEDYPALGDLLGWDELESLLKGYLATHPPDSFTLRDLGARLPAYVATRTDYTHHALMADMARHEWAFVDAFDAADMPPLDVTKLQVAGDALDGAVLVLDPSLVLQSYAYPVHELRPKLLHDEPYELPEPRACHVVVYRGLDRDLAYREVPATALATLAALRSGKSLAEALDGVAAGLPEAEVEALVANVGGWFASWVQSGFIRDVLTSSG